MEFEFDPAKSAANKDKHGIDFTEAQMVWEDRHHISGPAQILDEPRFMEIGSIDGRLWTAIFTFRDSRLRLISVRRSREKEAGQYEERKKSRTDHRR